MEIVGRLQVYHQEEKKIGFRGNSSVFKALNDKGEIFAIKHVKPHTRYLQREIQNLTLKLDYCISLVEAIDLPPDTVALVFKYYPASLEDILDGVDYNFPTRIKWLRQMCIGFAGIHRQNIIHRDIKPENILLTEKSAAADVIIADFGFSINTEIDLAKTCLGSNGYYAPEIPRGAGYTNKVDVYSFGMLAYALIFREGPPHRRGIHLPENSEFLPQEYYGRVYELMESCIQNHPEKRLTFDEILQLKIFKIDEEEFKRRSEKIKYARQCLSFIEEKKRIIDKLGWSHEEEWFGKILVLNCYKFAKVVVERSVKVMLEIDNSRLDTSKIEELPMRIQNKINEYSINFNESFYDESIQQRFKIYLAKYNGTPLEGVSSKELGKFICEACKYCMQVFYKPPTKT